MMHASDGQSVEGRPVAILGSTAASMTRHNNVDSHHPTPTEWNRSWRVPDNRMNLSSIPLNPNLNLMPIHSASGQDV